MSPTVFREKGYRFFFFSREESRIHVHVISGDGEAKYWLEPVIELTQEWRFSPMPPTGILASNQYLVDR